MHNVHCWGNDNITMITLHHDDFHFHHHNHQNIILKPNHHHYCWFRRRNQHHHRHRHCPHFNYHHRYHRRHMWWFAPPLSYLQTNKKTWRKNTQPTRQHSTGNIRDVIIIIMQLVCMTVWPSSHVLPRSFRRFLSKILHLKDRVLLWLCDYVVKETVKKQLR